MKWIQGILWFVFRYSIVNLYLYLCLVCCNLFFYQV